MPRTRIVVAGAGLIGRAHVAALQCSTTCVLAAIADPVPETSALAANCLVPHRSTLAEALELDRPDGVVLATPNTLHVPQALQCLSADVAVLIEKPVAPDLASATTLARAAGPNARVLVGHHRAHSGIMATARKVVESGRLGRLVAVTGSALYMKPDEYFAAGPWRSEPGGGPILINLIHEIHNLRMLMGEVVAVQAMASHAVRSFAVEDTAAITLSFASGALGSLVLSDTAAAPLSWELTSGENPAYPHQNDFDCYVVAGTRGALAIPTMRMTTYRSEEDRSWWTPFERCVVSAEAIDPIARQMEHFGAVARGEAAPLVSLGDGIANLRVTEAISAAVRSGATVRLDS
ncbi:MAG: Gfo/Idh/MocA family oxidoreductase [Burkholderiales bacterium]|nr:Gfo/Idh/MocA family oxidoreductase [Burkholderiales bacterium]